ncbi:hypothetical protein [Fastidiosibacter lacustris]|uniref:hypothetical protein n=1 Tax=Fastidiosibacter lacustris TaxID=2056695 RepID=UPI000E343B41|nr:hypothetical protein [Fastidiosibacter lacustris]
MPIFTNNEVKYRRKPTLDFWPFSYQGSTNLHWERALLELENLHNVSPEFKAFLRAKFHSDHPADLLILKKLDYLFQQGLPTVTEKIVHTYIYCVDWLNLFRNLYELIALTVKPLTMQLPFIGLAWQLFDTLIITTMAIYADQKQDTWARNVNLSCSSQLMICNSIMLSALLVSTCSALSLASQLAAGVGGVIALVISWALSQRTAKLCDARIDYLIHERLCVEKLSMFVPSEIIQQTTTNYQNWCNKIEQGQNSEVSYKNFMQSLQTLENNLLTHPDANKSNEHHEATLALGLCKSQVRKRELYYRLEKPLNFYTITTLALGILAVVLFCIGANMATFGLATTIFCSAMVIFGSLYNLYQKNRFLNANTELTSHKTTQKPYPTTIFNVPLNINNTTYVTPNS